MILTVRNIVTKREKYYKLHKPEDFNIIFGIYPRTLDIALKSDSVKDAAKRIAAYIDSSSRYHAFIANEMKKSEQSQEEQQQPKDVRLQTESGDAFATAFKAWADKRFEGGRGLSRDTTHVPDPGRARTKEEDRGYPITSMDRIKRRIEEEK